MARKIDWLAVLQEHHIPYIERGANVKRGNVAIQYPLCGTADPSQHMGLDLETGWWACWRNKEHRGKSPLWLFVKLLRIPLWKGKQLLGLDEDYVDPDGFDAAAARIMGRNERITSMQQVKREFLDFPSEFELIRPEGSTRRFFDYLCDERDFGFDGTVDLCRSYDVCCAKRGEYASRVILPYFINGELVAWTARAIGSASIRYKDLSLDDNLMPIKETLYNHDAVIGGGQWLIVVEGPMDAAKVDVFGSEFGVRAVGLSTNSLSEEQIYLIEEAATNFQHLGVMLDNATALARMDSMRMRQELATIRDVKSLPVPYGLKDPAMMRPREVRDWAKDLVNQPIQEVDDV